MKPSCLNSGLIATLLGTASLCAGEFSSETPIPSDSAVTSASSTESFYDKIWGLAKLYKGDDSDFLNEFALQGRLQLQYADGNSNSGEYDSHDRGDPYTWGPWEVRRWRLGFKSKWMQSRLSIEGQINVQPDVNVSSTGPSPYSANTDFYGNLYDLFATFTVSDALKISAGKTKVKFFSNEYFTSSKEILTFERSLLVNTLVAGEHTGAWVEGKASGFNYALAVFMGDSSPEFSRFDTGVFTQARIGYDFADAIGWEMAQVNLDWQQAWSDDTDGPTATYSSAFSLNSQWEQGKFGLVTDFLYGAGDQQNNRGSDVWGVTIMPSYYIAPSLQAVLRYQYAKGDGDESLRLQSRYERSADDISAGGRGDEYQAVYAGLNYFLYGHKLKLMTGVEWSQMDQPASNDDFDGWTFLVGMRMFF